MFITALTFLIVYFFIAIVACLYALKRGPYKEWDGSILIPIAMVVFWPVGIPWYRKQEPLNN
jgi:hypothetical protein